MTKIETVICYRALSDDREICYGYAIRTFDETDGKPWLAITTMPTDPDGFLLGHFQDANKAIQAIMENEKESNRT